MWPFASFLSILYFFLTYTWFPEAEALLDKSGSGSEAGIEEVTDQQRMLEEEEEAVSDSGTLTPGRGVRMEVDEPKAPAVPPLPKSDTASIEAPPKGSPLKSRSLGQEDAGGFVLKEKPLEEDKSCNSSASMEDGDCSSATKCSGPGMPSGTGFSGTLYESIRKLRQATAKPRMIGIHAETRKWAINLGDLTSEGGEWAGSAHYSHVYDSKMNIASSFNPGNLKCTSCPVMHQILERSGPQAPVCLILSDQCFPACLPASAGARCCAIIRVEDGSLHEILKATRKILRAYRVPAGSVMAICSASHLARVGTARYAADFTDAVRSVEADFGNQVRTIHGLPIFRTGVDDPPFPRTLLDLFDWLEDVDKKGLAHLSIPLQDYKRSFLLNAGVSEDAASVKLPLLLPASLRRKELANFLTGGHPNLVAKVNPCKDDQSREIIKSLLCSLNAEFALHLDTDAGLPQLLKGGEDHPGLDEDVLVVVGGASHAERLANALGLRHPHLADLTLPGWKLSEDSADDLASDIAGIMAANDPDKVILVLQVFDNTIFKGVIGDEIRSPVKLNGKYHVPGKLMTASQEELKALFGIASKIIRAAKTAQVYLISPLYRYVTGRCCRDAGHITNYSDPLFSKMMANSIQSIGKQLRSLVWHRHWKNVHVINPAAHMGIGTPNSLSEEEADAQLASLLERWGQDPVHPASEAYGQLAETLLSKMAEKKSSQTAEKSLELASGGKKRKRSPSKDQRGSSTGSQDSCRVEPHTGSRSGQHGHQREQRDASGPRPSTSGSGYSTTAQGGYHRGGRGGNAGWRGRGGYRGHSGHRGHRGYRGGHSGNAATWSGPR